MTRNAEVIHLAKQGYHLVPWANRNAANPHPLIKRWQTSPPSVESVEFFLNKWPDADWAVVPQETVVLDLENKNGLDGRADLFRLCATARVSYEMLVLNCAITRTKSQGLHLWFRVPTGCDLTGGCHLAPGVEVKRKNGSAHVPPSMGYEWTRPLGPSEELPVLPPWLVALWSAVKEGEVKKAKDYRKEIYHNGERRIIACSFAAKARDALNLNADELGALLRAVRARRMEDPETFTDEEVDNIANDYAQRDATDPFGLAMAGDKTAQSVIALFGARAGMVQLDSHDEDENVPTRPTNFTLSEDSEAALPIMPNDILRPTPAIAAFVDWADSCAIFQQSNLNLLSALTTFGTIMGRSIVGPTGLRANLYVAGLAPSGTGKELPRRASRIFLSECGCAERIGAENLGSGAGMLAQLNTTREVLWHQDELADKLKALSSVNCPGYLLEISTLLLSLYSGQTYTGKALKDAAATVTLVDPHPSLFATAQPRRFWEAINADMVESGLVGRFLVVNGGGFTVPHCRNPAKLEDCLPTQLIESVKHFLGNGPTAVARRSGGKVPQIVCPFTADGEEAYAELHTKWITRIQQLEHLGQTMDASIQSRVNEKALRLALIHAWSNNMTTPMMDAAAVKWGYRLANASQEFIMRGLMEFGSATPFEKDVKRILNIIRNNPEIPHRMIVRKTQHIEMRKRQDILAQLIESGSVTCVLEGQTRKYTAN